MVVKSRTSGMVDIVTYRYNGELVYVPVAPNYIEALAHARQAFPQLRRLRDPSLSLSMTIGQVEGFVGISELAWPKLIQHISRYQVIDVHVTQAHERGELPMNTTPADAEDVERTEPLPTLRSGKRNWFFRKLRTTAKNEYGDGRSTVPQRSSSYPVSTTSACFSYDCRVYAENPSQASSLVV